MIRGLDRHPKHEEVGFEHQRKREASDNTRRMEKQRAQKKIKVNVSPWPRDRLQQTYVLSCTLCYSINAPSLLLGSVITTRPMSEM